MLRVSPQSFIKDSPRVSSTDRILNGPLFYVGLGILALGTVGGLAWLMAKDTKALDNDAILRFEDKLYPSVIKFIPNPDPNSEFRWTQSFTIAQMGERTLFIRAIDADSEQEALGLLKDACGVVNQFSPEAGIKAVEVESPSCIERLR